MSSSDETVLDEFATIVTQDEQWPRIDLGALGLLCSRMVEMGLHKAGWVGPNTTGLGLKMIMLSENSGDFDFEMSMSLSNVLGHTDLYQKVYVERPLYRFAYSGDHTADLKAFTGLGAGMDEGLEGKLFALTNLRVWMKTVMLAVKRRFGSRVGARVSDLFRDIVQEFVRHGELILTECTRGPFYVNGMRLCYNRCKTGHSKPFLLFEGGVFYDGSTNHPFPKMVW
jgi:hypothetical protein